MVFYNRINWYNRGIKEAIGQVHKMIGRYYEIGGELNNEYGKSYKPRKQQIKMAREVFDTLKSNENLVVEAGTGVGKSLGYLIPLAFQLKRSKKKIRGLVSVGTKNLQSQLWNDRHIIEKMFELEIAMIKGRTSYPCLEKLDKNGYEVRECVNDNLELVAPYVSGEFYTESELCKGRSCTFYDECIPRRKRLEALDADIIIANNTLTVLNIELDGIIMGEFEYVVFDEAHELSDDVRRTLSSQVTPRGMKQTADEGNMTDEKLRMSIDKFKEILEEVSKDIEEDMEFTEEIAEKFGYIKTVPVLKADEKIEKACKSLNKQIESYNKAVKGAREGGSIKEYYSFSKTSLNIKQIDVSKFFMKLDNAFKSIIFTSATIFEGKEDLKYFRNFIGKDFTIHRTLDVGTVFDFKKQMKLWCSQDYDKNTEDYPDKVARVIRRLDAKRKPGEGIVVLFTSVKTMNSVAEHLTEYSIHRQHRENPNFKEDFFKDREGILLGVKSCWTGMDIKGDKLKYLVIAGLPFDALTWENTKVEEYLKSIGKNPFMDYSVPKMINTLRQGIGRLIRTVDDSGSVFLLDNKLLSGKMYTKTIFQSLPTRIKEF